MSEYILTANGQIYHADYYNEELYHYGIKGMKWGKRKARYETSDIRKRYDQAKANKKAANKSFNKAYNKYAANPLNAFTKKGNERWNDVYNKASASGNADLEYKRAKKARKKALKSARRDIESKASFGDKMMYNSATRKKAAKYVVDNNMSVAEATKKAKGDAWKNTAAFVAAYGAVAIGAAVASSKANSKYAVLDNAGKVLRRYN